MTLTVSSIGTNTVQITASGTDNTLATFTQAVADAIVGTTPSATRGWTLYDSTYVSVNGNTSQNLTQVFRALNVDGVTYKYMIFRWDTYRQILNTSCCELWNATTHVPTNEVWTYFNCAPISYNIHSCDFIIMVNPKWLVASSFLNNEASLWAGVFEVAREDVADTAAGGTPCFGWISSTLWNIGTSLASGVPLSGNDYPLISMPRLKNGNTGFNAARTFAGDYGITQVPNFLAPSSPTMTYYLSTSGNKFVNNGWSPTNRQVMPIKPIYNFSAAAPLPFGQIYGLKVLAPAGSQMNKIKLAVDANGDYSPSGTLTDHWLLNNHCKTYSNTPACAFANTYWIKTASIIASTQINKVVFVGQFYYCINGSTTALYKVNGVNTQYTTITPTGTIYDIVFDGERYLYMATSNGVARLDTVDDSYSTVSIAGGGASTVAITPTAIYASQYSLVASPVMYKIIRSTFALESGAVLSFTNGTATLSTFTETVRLIASVTDNEGNAWFATTVAAGSNFKLVKITPAGAISYVSSSLTNITWQVALSVLDNGNLYVQQHNTATNIIVAQVNPVNGSYITSNGIAVTTANIGSKGNNMYDGVMTTINIAGTLFTCLRGGGNAAYALWAQPLGAFSASVLTNPVTWNTTAFGTGASSNQAFWTDGARIISNTDTGIQVSTRVNAEQWVSGSVMGQCALPV